MKHKLHKLKILASSALAIMLLSPSFLHSEEQAINIKAVKKILPSTNIKDAFYTEIPGLLGAVLENNSIIYVYTPKELIFFGEIYSKDGVNITAEKHAPSNDADSSIAAIDLSPLMESASKINSGENEYGFIVFTDPDCPYCQRLENFLMKEKVDVYNVYTPIDSIHPNAREKSIRLLQEQNNISEKEATEKLRMGEAIANGIGVHATPITIVYKTNTNTPVTAISGADLEKVKKYIGGK
jgi:thiol:disulfide interchange protein DsbC